jgi:hypothetical protein
MVLPRFSRAGFMTTSLNDVAFEKLGETVSRLSAKNRSRSTLCSRRGIRVGRARGRDVSN